MGILIIISIYKEINMKIEAKALLFLHLQKQSKADNM